MNTPIPGSKYTVEELKEAFERVQDETNWKNPIRKWIHKEYLEITKEAIMFFTGTETEILADTYGKVYIHSVGYYGGPCN